MPTDNSVPIPQQSEKYNDLRYTVIYKVQLRSLALRYKIILLRLTCLLAKEIGNLVHLYNYTRVYQKKETFRNQAYCKNLNAFSIAHMLNRGRLPVVREILGSLRCRQRTTGTEYG
jgi:hypothetical protein